MAIIGDILYYTQPAVFRELVSIFSSDDFEPEPEPGPIGFVEQPPDPEDDPEFRKYRNIMTERKAVSPK